MLRGAQGSQSLVRALKGELVEPNKVWAVL